MPEERPRIAFVVEAPADTRTGVALFERALCEVDWVEPETVAHLWEQAELDPQVPALEWKKVRELCEAHGVRIHGHFDGQPGAPDARAARKALLLLRRVVDPDAVVLLRDHDRQAGRRVGLNQAREDSRSGFAPERVVIGLAIPEREAWHLCGFEADTEDERERLATERERLGFDPTRSPEQLGGNEKRDAKAALEALCGSDLDRQARCLSADLEALRERGRSCGLADYLDELDERLVPLVTDPRARRP